MWDNYHLCIGTRPKYLQVGPHQFQNRDGKKHKSVKYFEEANRNLVDQYTEARLNDSICFPIHR